MVEIQARREPVRLNYRDGQVMVTPEDQDVFFLSAQKATDVCRETVQADQRIARFNREILVPLHEWCVQFADRVFACYVPLPVRDLQVFVVTRSPKFDFDLGLKIAELEKQLARAGWMVGVSQLPMAPKESLGTFFNPNGALEVYAQRRPASCEGGE